MRILVVGGGGREHALAWRLHEDGHEVISAPGNAGLAELGAVFAVAATDVQGLLALAREQRVEYTVVGPEAPLAAGIVDEFLAAGMRVSGPKRGAARVEASKVFAKNLMRRHRIPTADFEIFDDPDAARAYVERKGAPIVVKADGLAAGKGVVVARDKAEALQAIEDIMEARVHGDAGARVVVEKFLAGREVSILAFTDGETVVPLVPAKDYKPAYDGDRGPNTGGMGTYSPVPHLSRELLDRAIEIAVRPTISGLLSEGIRYRGVLYVGMIVTEDGLSTLEYNARFGDPETQVQMPRLATPLLEVLEACSEGRLAEVPVRWHDEAAVCVVVASEGYPGSYAKGAAIEGLADAGSVPGAVVFHAGTRPTEQGAVSDGGRVLGVTATGATIADARQSAYEATRRIRFPGAWSRTDIALDAEGT